MCSSGSGCSPNKIAISPNGKQIVVYSQADNNNLIIYDVSNETAQYTQTLNAPSSVLRLYWKSNYIFFFHNSFLSMYKSNTKT